MLSRFVHYSNLRYIDVTIALLMYPCDPNISYTLAKQSKRQYTMCLKKNKPWQRGVEYVDNIP